jgi:hypothetical protein
MRFDPTQSRGQGEPVLQTYGEGKIDGERAVVARFGQRLAMVRVASGCALALRSSSTTLPCSPQAPPWVNCFGLR